MKAYWNDTLIAESDDTRIVENNHYFPMKDIRLEYFIKSPLNTRCVWKGEASYFHIKVDGELNKDAAWYYPTTSHAAKPIENYVAFWKGVKVSE
ncbi:DUF427 domain-containing protein [Christiangramia salexigens]|uniref:DUF427 domain-containing protein n=1 Tax=Christiangramia salexigens TaxID=1913577 RepID=A0A1L3J5A5_9FLAO|nr:DUF427 domain-containing protein [Christiangramia salexigens]APG60315.1 hypothetical protein LPB144_07790 [Christiangramia salexigens]